MNYFIALLITLFVVVCLTYLISTIDDPSGDGTLGLTVLVWLVGTIVGIFIISFWVASAIFGDWYSGFFIAAIILFLLEKKFTNR